MFLMQNERTNFCKGAYLSPPLQRLSSEIIRCFCIYTICSRVAGSTTAGCGVGGVMCWSFLFRNNLSQNPIVFYFNYGLRRSYYQLDAKLE